MKQYQSITVLHQIITSIISVLLRFGSMSQSYVTVLGRLWGPTCYWLLWSCSRTRGMRGCGMGVGHAINHIVMLYVILLKDSSLLLFL
jgi:hypothetical protein